MGTEHLHFCGVSGGASAAGLETPLCELQRLRSCSLIFESFDKTCSHVLNMKHFGCRN